jgi:hypothetical protein
MAIELAAGVKAGVNLTRFWGNTTPYAYDHVFIKSGFTSGGVVQFGATKHFAIQPEVLFSIKGHKEEIEGLDYVSLNTRFLEIPFLCQLRIPAPKILTPLVYEGQALAIRLSGIRIDAQESGKKYDRSEPFIADLPKDKNMALSLTGGYQFAF